MDDSHADHNLLLGILALQMDLIDRDQLIEAMSAWATDKSNSLAHHLMRHNGLDQSELQSLEELVGKQLNKRDDALRRNLVALSVIDPLAHRQLQTISDDAIEASMADAIPVPGAMQDSNAPDATLDYSPRAADERFAIIRIHAQGGLGEVYEAEDQELHRQVALKQIRPELATNATSKARFLLEAEVTGGLEHPSIVPVYAMGQQDDGRPFYVMRFIRGTSLAQTIKDLHSQRDQMTAAEYSLQFRRLLKHFLDVCEAVEYAHSRGIVHRDLKPSNIMLGRYGETMVVDWGLAKVVGRSPIHQSSEQMETTLVPRLSGSASTETHMGQAIGTPAYMSPEQAAGDHDRVGPASDVYCLGATLFTVLTAKRPFEGELAEVLDKVQQGKVLRPKQVEPRCPPPLDAVCRKAMRQHPDDRYETPSELAADIEAWLAGERVHAWTEPVSVRAMRWIRRHRTLVTGTTAAAVVAIVVLAWSLTVMSIKNRQLDAAQTLAADNARESKQNYQHARTAVDEFFTVVSENSLLNRPGMHSIRKELLNKALGYYEQFLKQRGNDSSISDQLALTHYRVGLITSRIGKREDAVLSLRRASIMQRQLVDKTPENVSRLKGLGNTLNALGNSLLRNRYGHQEARRIYQSAIKARSKVNTLEPNRISHQRALANSQSTWDYVSNGKRSLERPKRPTARCSHCGES